MRFTEFGLITEMLLNEVNMSPSALKKMAASISAKAGMEFEMIVPDVSVKEYDDDDFVPEPDYDYDQRALDFDSILNFFSGGEGYNSRDEINRLASTFNDQFDDWMNKKADDAWRSDEGREFFDNWADDQFDEETTREDIEERIRDKLGDDADEEEIENLIMAKLAEEKEEWLDNEWDNEKGWVYRNARKQFIENWHDENNLDESNFLSDQGIRYMTDVVDQYDITWPYYTSMEESGGSGQSMGSVAVEFEKIIGRPVTYGDYHSGEFSQTDNYRVEKDTSLEGDSDSDSGLEFISPPLPINEMFDDLDKVIAWAKSKGCYTGDDYHTGLHMNISVQGKGTKDLDYVKLALFLGDEYVLEEFGREANRYCESAMKIIKKVIVNRPDKAKTAFEQMRTNLGYKASAIIHNRATSKYTSINVKDGYVEFRSPGGDWLNADIKLLKNTLLRFVVALDIASDPDKYKNEYGKKLYNLLKPSEFQYYDPEDPINAKGPKKMFDVPGKGRRQLVSVDPPVKQVQYQLLVELFYKTVTGEISKSEFREKLAKVRSMYFSKQKPGTDGKKYWWRVTNPANSAAGIEVVADSQEAAIARAVMPGNYPEWAGVQSALQATPVRPYEEEGRSHPAAQRYAPDSASGSTLYKVYSIDNPETILAAFYARTGDMDGARMQFRNKLRAMGIESPAGYGFAAID
jgi:hypothetical protein